MCAREQELMILGFISFILLLIVEFVPGLPEGEVHMFEFAVGQWSFQRYVRHFSHLGSFALQHVWIFVLAMLVRASFVLILS